MRRTIRADIQIEIVNGGGLWYCEVDPIQFESAVLNLVINARDSMPNGGRITIETSNAHLDDNYAKQYPNVNPGQHVQLTVTDTGTGMSDETISKAFDPFFTTKDEGEGSGLGLSMVYGFVKQSGGSINIYSELDEGTTIKIYMPRVYKDVGSQLVSYSTSEPLEGSHEAVLVVEDNEKLGKVVTEMLRELNFSPLYASNVDQAIELLESSDVDVVLTDVILPGGKKGADLATYVRENLPHVPVIFMSGYTENSIIHDGRLDPGVELLEKPFSVNDLSIYIGKALNRLPDGETGK